jgi:hypothetical protein
VACESVAKNGPVTLNSVIFSGTALPFEREKAVLAVWPTDTAPKFTELDETTRVPVAPSLTTKVPQPEIKRTNQLHKTISSAAQQMVDEEIAPQPKSCN